MKCSGRASYLQVKPMSTCKCRMAQSFDDGCVGVFKSSVFADQTDCHLTRQVIGSECKHHAATSTTFTHSPSSPTRHWTTVKKQLKISCCVKTQTCVTPSTITLKAFAVCIDDWPDTPVWQIWTHHTSAAKWVDICPRDHAPPILALKVRGPDQMSPRSNHSQGSP